MLDPIILVGDRVAIAPHTDLWAMGARYGTVVASTTGVVRGRIHHLFYVRTDADSSTHVLDSGDLLAAIRPEGDGWVMG